MKRLSEEKMKGLIDSFLDMFNNYVPERAGTYVPSTEKMSCGTCQARVRKTGKKQKKGKGKK